MQESGTLIQRSERWDNDSKTQATLALTKSYKDLLQDLDHATTSWQDLITLYGFYKTKEATEEELKHAYQDFNKILNDLTLKQILQKSPGGRDAIVEINPGSGGVDSQDWAAMLLRMYTMWAKKQGYTVQHIYHQTGESGGIKAATLAIQGPHVCTYLKPEIGVHRLVRLSPFDAQKRRHTSFASVYAYPMVQQDIDVSINPADIKWETFRSGGSGGQHANKVETAVRLRHAPSGLVVTCQQERSQIQNKNRALEILKSKLYQRECDTQQAQRAATTKQQKKIAFGSQIRSYVLHPYKMVKDLRTGLKTSQVQTFLDGDLQNFIQAYLLEYA